MGNHNEFVAQVVRHLPEMTVAVRQHWIKNPGLLKTALATALATTFLTGEYFITRPGLWVSTDFKLRITSAYPEALVPRGLHGVESFDLTNGSSDQDILTKMGGEENVLKHAFTPDQLSDLINLQENGESGQLQNNGCANLFYVVGANGVLFVVSVLWYADGRGWSVSAWELGGVRWPAGLRVFRNT